MRPLFLNTGAAILACVYIYGCKNSPAGGEQPAQDSVQLSRQKPVVTLNDLEGSVGVLNVPEMVSLCILDSATEQEVAGKMSRDFITLDKELEETGAETNGPPGLIYYNNDPKNFKFECVRLIRAIPATVPKHSRIVTLEADQMLVYNYYGPYNGAFKAYEEIRRLCATNQLVQSGPMREFYPAVTLKSDTSKKLTRIMVPVRAKENSTVH